MRNRRLAISAAVVGSLGIALVPALAEAAQTSHVHSVNNTQKASAFTKVKVFSSKGSNSGIRSRATATGPNPNLMLLTDGYQTAAYSIEIDLGQSGLTSGTATVSVNWGDGNTDSYTLNAADTDPDGDGTYVPATHEYSALGTYTTTLTITDGAGDTPDPTTESFQTAGSLYHAYGPVRILDTRKGLGASKAAVAAKGTLKLQVTGAGLSGNAIPAGITAVVMNVTSTGSTANGAVTVYGDQDSTGTTSTRPSTSNLNYGKGQNIPNQVIVPVGKNGVVDFYNNSSGSTNLIADVAGYFTNDNTGDKYVSVSPARILDTRKGIGAKKAQIPANSSITLTIDGADSGKIPASKVSAVALNLTAVAPAANGVITAYPTGESLPTVSNVNYSTGSTVANLANVPVGSNGTITLHNDSTKAVDLLADVAGFYTSDSSVAGASAYIPFADPDRYFDTRSNGIGPISAGDIWTVLYASSDETAFVINATAVAPSANGYLSLYSFDPNNVYATPTTSNLNYAKGQTVPNLAIVAPGTTPDPSADGLYDVGLFLGGTGSANVILDVFGFYTTD